MTKNSIILTVWVMTVLYFGQIIVPEIVLCFGTDGHIDLESSYKDSCDLSSIRILNELSIATADNNVPRKHCGSCTDIPITVGKKDKYTFNKQLTHHTVQPIQSSIFPPYNHFTCSGNIATNSIDIIYNPFLSSITSVVLLV